MLMCQIFIVNFCTVLLGCTDLVDIQQSGDNQFGPDRLAIIPRLNFTCDGRITNIRARVSRNISRDDFPSFQVWRPSQPGSVIYNRTGEVQLQSDDQVTRGSNGFLEANIILTGDDRIEFQSGDVVGYYHPSNSRYLVRDIQTNGYFLHRFDRSPPPTSVNLSEANFMLQFRQPLIRYTVGKVFFI